MEGSPMMSAVLRSSLTPHRIQASWHALLQLLLLLQLYTLLLLLLLLLLVLML
jgi:hypothetical protein